MIDVNDLKDEYKYVYPCEFCGSKTYPAMEFQLAEYHDASIGAIIIRRHSQPPEKKHKQGNIPICNECIQNMSSRGELVIDAHKHTWVFAEDNLSQRKF